MNEFFGVLGKPETYRNLGYDLLAFPLGIAYFVFLVTGLSVGAGLVVIWVGVPILLGMILAWRALGAFERGLHRSLLGVDVAEPLTTFRGKGSLWVRTKGLLGDPVTWRTLAWLFLRFPAGIGAFVVTITLLATSIGLVAGPLAVTLFPDAVDAGADFTVDPDLAIWLLPVGILLLFATAHVVNGIAWLHGVVGKALLGPTARERERALQRRTSMLEERTRLAHELHDSVGHTVTVMVLQAGAGRKLLDSDPEFAKQTLETIETSGRRALAELDRVLGLLRADDAREGDRAPQPGLGRLPTLIAQVEEAGLSVTLEQEGSLDGLPHDLDRSAYRIVQESLTNVLKHAGPVATRVSVARQPEALTLEVVNGGAAVPALDLESGGHGLVGIRERVAVFDGDVEAGPRNDGGFRVWVRLPLGG
jgi:signal transduction histidine kinase